MQGSSAQSSSREKPASLRPEVQDNLPVLDGHAITDERVVENTFINQTAVNEDAFRDRQSIIAGFPEGRIIVVTYFSQNRPITNMQSDVVDMQLTTKDDVHISYTQIRNFELRCSRELSFEYEQESNKSKVSGEAIMFPRFTPRVSDIFLYEMRNGKIGVFRITGINRLALGQDTYHSVTFTMQEFLNATYRDRLQRQSTITMYFDKYKYLAGNTTLLTTDAFQQKKDLEHIRLEIIEDYIERFYDREYSTFMRPDGIYDPYIVEYWNKKVSIQDSTPHMRPTQILISVSNYRKTLWAVLTNNPIKNLANVEKSWSIKTYNSTFWGVNITSLLGKKYLAIGDEPSATNGYAINNRGEPILIDPRPTFHEPIPPEVTDRAIEKDFYRARKLMYKDLPNKRCPPHAHGENAEILDLCYPDQCNHCAFGKPKVLPPPMPPFPIMSTDDLATIWLAMHHKPKDYVPNDDDMARVRGYIRWYRDEYPGTLPKEELEEMWRNETHIPLDQELTEAEAEACSDYVKSYRKQFLAVLTDRQIEYKWRMNRQISGDVALTNEEIAELILTIVEYRRNHGYPDENSSNELGSPMHDEFDATVYDQVIVLEPPTLFEIDNLISRTENGNVNVDLSTNISRVFYPRKHPHNAHHYHHTICHYLCGDHAGERIKAKEKADLLNSQSHYAMSNEFYNGSCAMDPFEKIVFDLVTNKDVDPAKSLESVTRYKEWSDEDAFYRHLLALYVIDKTLYWLMYH